MHFGLFHSVVKLYHMDAQFCSPGDFVFISAGADPDPAPCPASESCMPAHLFVAESLRVT